MSAADWIALAAAVLSLVIAVAAMSSARSAKRASDAAETQAAEAKRASDAAEDSAATARRSIGSLVDFTPVLMKVGNVGNVVSPESGFKLLEVRWKGPKVWLERFAATKWLAVDSQGNAIPDQVSASEVPLEPAAGARLPIHVRNGEKLLFEWPGPGPGPGGLGAEVRAEYRLGDAPDALTRQVEIFGYSGFRG